MIETHRSFVNRWECDENNHMNVQFYMKRFDEATQIMDAIEGHKAPRPTMRHVRYHRELLEGDGAIIRSGWFTDGDGNTHRVHIMSHSETGKICTTALDTFAKSPPARTGGPVCDGSDLEPALPRGLDDAPIIFENAEATVAKKIAVISNYSIVEDHDRETDGHLHFNRIISRFTDGAPHIWDLSGLTTSWLQNQNLGRVAVEMKVMATSDTLAGTALRLISCISDRNEKTFRILHQLQEIVSGKVIALGEVRCLILDLERRKAVALPETFLTQK